MCNSKTAFTCSRSISRRRNAGGFSLIELLIVVVVITILTAVSIPYLYQYRKLYKSEDQAIKLLDLMREAGQLALTHRRTIRLEIDLTDNAVLLIDENGTAADTLIKTVPIESELRLDAIPSGVNRPNPPNYNDAVFANDALGHNVGATPVTGHRVWAARFRSDGSAVNAANTPVSSTIYLWPPKTPGNADARDKREIRAITMFGGSGAIRYWKYDGANFLPY